MRLWAHGREKEPDGLFLCLFVAIRKLWLRSAARPEEVGPYICDRLEPTASAVGLEEADGEDEKCFRNGRDGGRHSGIVHRLSERLQKQRTDEGAEQKESSSRECGAANDDGEN